jgi:hypothetical protein
LRALQVRAGDEGEGEVWGAEVVCLCFAEFRVTATRFCRSQRRIGLVLVASSLPPTIQAALKSVFDGSRLQLTANSAIDAALSAQVRSHS